MKNSMHHKIASVLVAGAGLLLWSAPACGTILSIQAVTPSVRGGQVGGSFDVLLTNDGASGITVAAFSFEISTTDPSILFTDANTSTASAAYIFGGGDSFFSPDLTPGFAPSNVLNALDLSFSGSGTVVDPGSTVGLGHVLFDVAGNAAPGPFTITFAGGTTFNNLSDPKASDIPIDASSSGLNYSSPKFRAGTIPALLLLLTGAALVSARRLFLGRRA